MCLDVRCMLVSVCVSGSLVGWLWQAVGHQLVLTAVNGDTIEDPQGMGQFRAGLEAVKKAKRPIVLRLQRLQVVSAEPEPEAEPELEPKPEPEPGVKPATEPVDAKAQVAGDRGVAATRKTRNALLGGLRSGTLEGECCVRVAAPHHPLVAERCLHGAVQYLAAGAVSKMEDDLHMEELRAKASSILRSPFASSRSRYLCRTCSRLVLIRSSRCV